MEKEKKNLTWAATWNSAHLAFLPRAAHLTHARAQTGTDRSGPRVIRRSPPRPRIPSLADIAGPPRQFHLLNRIATNTIARTPKLAGNLGVRATTVGALRV